METAEFFLKAELGVIRDGWGKGAEAREPRWDESTCSATVSLAHRSRNHLFQGLTALLSQKTPASRHCRHALSTRVCLRSQAVAPQALS